jgi:signal transduction histidine kinase
VEAVPPASIPRWEPAVARRPPTPEVEIVTHRVPERPERADVPTDGAPEHAERTAHAELDDGRHASATERLRAAEERYGALFNAIDQGFCTIEVRFDESGRAVDYRFLEVSPSFERQTGITRGEGRWMRDIAPDQDEHWFELYGAVATTGEPHRFESYSTPLGRWWSVYAFRIGDPSLRQVAILFNDITDRKRAEQEREARLEQERVRREAAEAFLAVMSHELRTPVTSIYGNALLLSRNPRRDDVEDLVRDLREESERLRRIIDDLLVLSGIERGFLELAPEPTLLQHAIRDVVIDLKRRHPATVFIAEIPKSLAPVLADTTALRQVLHNLLSNAAKYAGDDGPVRVVVSDTGTRVEVAVLDEGPGLGTDPGALFDLFYRAPETAKRASGTGIGLYVARELARAMDSNLDAFTRPEGGACFRFTLPLVQDA